MLPEAEERLIFISAQNAQYHERSYSSDSDTPEGEEFNTDTDDVNMSTSHVEDNDVDVPLCRLGNFTVSLKDDLEYFESSDKNDTDCCRVDSLKEEEIAEEVDTPKKSVIIKRRKRSTISRISIDGEGDSLSLEATNMNRYPKRSTHSRETDTDEKPSGKTNIRRSARLTKSRETITAKPISLVSLSKKYGTEDKHDRNPCSDTEPRSKMRNTRCSISISNKSISTPTPESQKNTCTSTMSNKYRRSEAKSISTPVPRNANGSHPEMLEITPTVAVKPLRRARSSKVNDTRTEAQNTESGRRQSVRLQKKTEKKPVLSVSFDDENTAGIRTPKMKLRKVTTPGVCGTSIWIHSTESDSMNESTPIKHSTRASHRSKNRTNEFTPSRPSRCSRRLSLDPPKVKNITDEDGEPIASDCEDFETSDIDYEDSGLNSDDSEDDEPISSDPDDDVFVPGRSLRSTNRATPRTPRIQKNKVGTPTTPRTPRLRVNSLLPSLPSRSSGFSTPSTPKDRAMVALHISSIPESPSCMPESLPCRQAEYDNIYKFLSRKIKGTDGGFMYVYGIPGAGKTATVERVVRRLKLESSNKKIRLFKFVEINGMHLKRPKDTYSQIWKKLKNKSASANTARRLLEQEFRTTFKKQSLLLLIDEFDMLFNRTLSVIDTILDWVDQSKLIVVGIANSKDLIEEINRSSTKSRLLRERLCDVQFKTYTYQQLQEIIELRLQKNKVFTKEAIELLARKSALSGDVRIALNLCRRVLVEAGDIGKKEVIDPVRVMQLLDKINKDPKIEFMKHLSRQEHVLLRAIRDIILTSGIPTCSLDKNLYEHYKTLCILDAITVKDDFSLFRMLRLLQTYAIITLSESPTIHTEISLGNNLDLIQIAFPPQMRE